MAHQKKIGNSDKSMTAVEWLFDKLKSHFEHDGDLLEGVIMTVEQAKQMEKQQHQETFKQSRQAKIFEDGMPPVWESFEHYYNEIYGKDSNESNA